MDPDKGPDNTVQDPDAHKKEEEQASEALALKTAKENAATLLVRAESIKGNKNYAILKKFEIPQVSTFESECNKLSTSKDREDITSTELNNNIKSTEDSVAALGNLTNTLPSGVGTLAKKSLDTKVSALNGISLEIAENPAYTDLKGKVVAELSKISEFNKSNSDPEQFNYDTLNQIDAEKTSITNLINEYEQLKKAK